MLEPIQVWVGGFLYIYYLQLKAKDKERMSRGVGSMEPIPVGRG